MTVVHLHDGSTLEMAPRRGVIQRPGKATGEPWTGRSYELFHRLVEAHATQDDPLVPNKLLSTFGNIDNVIAGIHRRLSPDDGHRYVVSVKGNGRVYSPWAEHRLGRITQYLAGRWNGRGWLVAPYDPGKQDPRVTEAVRNDLWRRTKDAEALRFDYEMDVAIKGPNHLAGEARVRSVRIDAKQPDEVVWDWDKYTVDMWPDRNDRPRVVARFTSLEFEKWSDDGAGTFTVEDSEAGGTRYLQGLFAANKLTIPSFTPCDLAGVEVIRMRFDKVVERPSSKPKAGGPSKKPK